MKDKTFYIVLDEPKKKRRKSKNWAKPISFFLILAVVLYAISVVNPFKKNITSAVTEKVSINPISAIETKAEEIFVQAPSPTPTPTPQITRDTAQIQKEIQTILGNEETKYGIYINDLRLNQFVGINENEIFPPASIYKVPLAMLVLKSVDKGTLDLNTKYTLKGRNKAYTTDSMYYLPTGGKYPLSKYLEYLIKMSDNTAMLSLEEILGGTKVINKRLQTELEITRFFREPHESTAKEISAIFEKIYKQTYLSPDSNNFLLDLLKHTGNWLQDRIPAGLPKGTEVAHKIGYLYTGKGSAYEDAGIVYNKENDYIIVVVNQDVKEDDARSKIVQISKATYEWFNN